MTSQHNLRDRIAQIFYQVGNGVLVLNMSPNERNDLAQAIIDELRLETYEFTRHDGHTTTHVHGWMEQQR